MYGILPYLRVQPHSHDAGLERHRSMCVPLHRPWLQRVQSSRPPAPQAAAQLAADLGIRRLVRAHRLPRRAYRGGGPVLRQHARLVALFTGGKYTSCWIHDRNGGDAAGPLAESDSSMTRRRRRPQPSNLEAVLALPWWGRALAGLVVFVGMRVAAAALQASPITVFLATLIRDLSGFTLALFALLSLVGLLQELAAKRRTVTAPKPIDPWHNVPWNDTRPLPSASSARTPVSAGSATASLPKAAATALSLDLLREIEWHRFEQVCAAYWREAGMVATLTPFGADGGVDVELRQAGEDTPEALVQCKAWNATQVGVKLVRELLGVVTDRKVERGIFMTTGTFTTDAIEFARGNRLDLIDGSDLVGRIHALPVDAQARLLTLATDGDYTTPTCPACGIKMVLREGKEGSRAFWGCRNYPKGCRQTLKVARPDR